MGSICADDEIKGDFNLHVSGATYLILRRPPRHLEPSFPPLDIGAGELMVEEELHVWHGLELVQEHLVEPSPVGCKIGLQEHQEKSTKVP
jgi:hypothetical protein